MKKTFKSKLSKPGRPERILLYRCQSCGAAASEWAGRCPNPECGELSCLVEEEVHPAERLAVVASGGLGVPGVPGATSSSPGGGLLVLPGLGGRPVSVAEVASYGDPPRTPTTIAEFDRVLGGGLVPGSVVLIGGEPGVGKSTLLLQASCALALSGKRILYVTGEESVAQVAMRARRVCQAAPPSLFVHSETLLERVLYEASSARPDALVLDSIQTIASEAASGVPGSVMQVRECAARLVSHAKVTGVPILLVGHVTKDGDVAGPKTMEHLVDAVLSFEGEGARAYRVLRATKNRFGATSEVGVFAMRAGGLVEVPNPSELFLAERPEGAPGSVVAASASGARPILVEVQALCADAATKVGRVTAAGLEQARVALLLAVLAERAGCRVLVRGWSKADKGDGDEDERGSPRDVFVNLAGGLRLAEPALDLAIACALASAERGVPPLPRTVVFGEVGLTGEVRAVSLPELRLAEAAKLGFTRAVVPFPNCARLEAPAGLELVPVAHLRDALAAVLGG